jgi:hypothetical protein
VVFLSLIAKELHNRKGRELETAYFDRGRWEWRNGVLRRELIEGTPSV